MPVKTLLAMRMTQRCVGGRYIYCWNICRAFRRPDGRARPGFCLGRVTTVPQMLSNLCFLMRRLAC